MMRFFTAISFVLVLGACIGNLPPPEPGRSFAVGELLYQTDFSSADTWDEYQAEGVFMGVENVHYRAILSIPNRYIWATNHENYNNIIIETEVGTRSNTEDKGYYGVICRADSSTSRGYHFLVSVDGSYSIRRSDGVSTIPIIKWQDSSAIYTDFRRNRIRALCIDDYLALYINGQFVADARNNLYTSGSVGIVVGIADEGEVDVTFDSLRVLAGQ